MSKYLFFDCETTGLPISRYFSPWDVSGWPRLVQLAWVFYDSSGKPQEKCCYIVRPMGFQIPREATRFHGISHSKAVRAGEDLTRVLAEFTQALEQADVMLVAHHLDFDRSVVGAELIRNQMPSRLWDLPGFCTMLTTTDLCRLPRPGYGYKWPKLEELHEFLFGESYERPHDAANDVEACARCFFELVKKKYICLPH
jgi:DNA polymerase III epsilon subunit-like protein